MPTLAAYSYAIIRVVPRVERDEFVNAGVVLLCRARRFLAAHVALDPERLAALAPDVDYDAVAQHLAAIPRICAGEADAGPIALLPLTERFDWLVAPRSAMIQTGPVHGGMCLEPSEVLERLAKML